MVKTMNSTGSANLAAAQTGSLRLDERSPMPLYHQVYLILRTKILDGEYACDDFLPGEQETAEQFGVSRITAKRALNDLMNDGMVERRRGRGTRVTYRPAARPVRASVEGMLENLLAMGLKTDVDLKSFEYAAAGDDVATALGCARGDMVQRAVRVRSLDGEPFSYLTTFVPEDIARGYDAADLASRPLLLLLEREGVIVSRAEQTISATLADAVVADALAVELASPLLRIARTVYDQQARAVEYITALYRPELYQYQMTLSRVENEQVRTWSPAM